MKFNLAFEYDNYIGYEKYAVATDLSEAELRNKYGEEIEALEPFIIISWEMGMIMREHNNNDAKWRMRALRGMEALVSDIIDEFYGDDSYTANANLEYRNALIMDAVNRLNETSRARIIDRFFNDFSLEEISQKYGYSIPAASMDIKKILKQLRIKLEKKGVS